MAGDMNLTYTVDAETEGMLELSRGAAKAEKDVTKSFKKMDNEVDKFGNELDAAGKAMGRFIDKSGRMREANGQFVKGMQQSNSVAGKISNQLTSVASAIGGIVAGMQLAAVVMRSINVQAGFEASIADLAAITGATGEDLRFLSDEAKRLGSATKYTASEVAEAFKLMASAKPDLLDNSSALAETTKQTLLLATASGTDLATAAETVGSSLNQFAAGAESSARFVNVLAAGAKYGASEVMDTAEALKNSGVAAKSAGISFEETNAAIQALAGNAIKGSEAGTALRNIFLKLDTSTDNSLRPSIVGLNKALENLEKKQLTSAEMVKMFGLENITAATAIMANREQVAELTKKLTGTTVAQEQAAIKADTLRTSQLNLASAIEGLQISIVEYANPALRAMIDYMVEATKGATFFWRSLNDNSIEGMTSKMADLNEEIGEYRKATKNMDMPQWRRDVAQSKLDQATKELAELRKKYQESQGLTAPSGKKGSSSKSEINKIKPPIDTTGIDELTKKLETSKEKALRIYKDINAEILIQTADGSAERKSLMQKNEEQYQSALKGLTVKELKVYTDKGVALARLEKDQFDAKNNLLSLSGQSELAKIKSTEQQALTQIKDDLNKKLISYSQYETAKKQIQDKAKQDELKSQLEKDKKTMGADPYAQEGIDYATKLQALEAYKSSEFAVESRYRDMKLQAQAEHEANIQLLQEQTFRAASAGNEALMATLDSLSGTATNVFSGMLSGTMSATDAMKSFGNAILNEAIGSLVQMGIEQVKQAVMGKALQASTTAATIAQAAILAAAWKPAAISASIATSGGASAAGYSSFLANNPFSVAGGRLNGGPTQAGKAYRVNENGRPEMYTNSSGQSYMMGGGRGHVTPAGEVGGGKPITISQSFIFKGGTPTDMKTMQQFAQMAKTQAMQVIQEQSRQGGMLAR